MWPRFANKRLLHWEFEVKNDENIETYQNYSDKALLTLFESWLVLNL